MLQAHLCKTLCPEHSVTGLSFQKPCPQTEICGWEKEKKTLGGTGKGLALVSHTSSEEGASYIISCTGETEEETAVINRNTTSHTAFHVLLFPPPTPHLPHSLPPPPLLWLAISLCRSAMEHWYGWQVLIRWTSLP